MHYFCSPLLAHSMSRACLGCFSHRALEHSPSVLVQVPLCISCPFVSFCHCSNDPPQKLWAAQSFLAAPGPPDQHLPLHVELKTTRLWSPVYTPGVTFERCPPLVFGFGVTKLLHAP